MTTTYDCDPVELAQTYQNAGAQMLHVVDLDGAFAESNSINRVTLERIVMALEIPVQFGGGLRTVADVNAVLKLGTTRVVLGTLASESPETVKQLIESFGGDRIVVGIDDRDGEVLT